MFLSAVTFRVHNVLCIVKQKNDCKQRKSYNGNNLEFVFPYVQNIVVRVEVSGRNRIESAKK